VIQKIIREKLADELIIYELQRLLEKKISMIKHIKPLVESDSGKWGEIIEMRLVEHFIF
jgi:hypothetical protein